MFVSIHKILLLHNKMHAALKNAYIALYRYSHLECILAYMKLKLFNSRETQSNAIKKLLLYNYN